MPPDCEEWTGTRYEEGYGRVQHKGKPWRAHRLVWTLANGPIPEGLLVLHSCDNPPCVKLEHLSLGTQLDNSRQCLQRGRNHNQKKMACPRGHTFTGANVTVGFSGGYARRRCVTCSRQYSKDYRAARVIMMTKEGGSG